VTRALVVGAYGALGAILSWSHLANLGGGYCCDEIATVVDYIAPGPRTILAGSYVPNNHELYSLIGWWTDEIIGDSPTVLRLWAAIPFLVGVALVTVWVHVRVAAFAGILFLLLATASPLLLDITRQARGYGLAFLAMSVLVIAALEALRSGATGALVAFFVAGLVGSWTLPHFAIGFITTAAVLLTDRELRARCALGLGVSLAAVAAWYLPHYDDIASSSNQWYGHRIDAAWALTSPIDQTIVPALNATDDVFLEPSLASTLYALGVLVLVASSPFLRDVRTALALCAPTIVTVLAFWGTQTKVGPRFFSFLLVALFVLVATGAAAIVADVRTRPRLLRTLVAVGVFAAIMVVSAPLVWAIPRLPRQAHREVAETIEREAPGAPVYAHVVYPGDLEYHLGRRVIAVYTPAAVAHMCDTERSLAYVDQKWLVRPVTPPCLDRPGTRHYRWRQSARGEAIELWLIPTPR
jgi:hypothetical protein